MPARKGKMSYTHFLNITYNLGLLTALSILVRLLLKIINPLSNALLRANRYFVERGAV